MFLIIGLIHRFSGDKSNANFFKILGSDETSLLIGARNVVYNISLPSLKENIDQVRYCFLKVGWYWNVSYSQSMLESTNHILLKNLSHSLNYSFPILTSIKIAEPWNLSIFFLSTKSSYCLKCKGQMQKRWTHKIW